MTIRYEKQFLKEGSFQQLEQVRNEALEILFQITAEIKKRL